jgi:putative aldouronate transport system permease protein
VGLIMQNPIKHKSKKGKGDILFDLIIYTILVLIAIITIYPFFFTVIRSFNEGTASSNTYFWPSRPTIENYVTFFKDGKWLNGLVISILRTLIGTVTSVFFTCIVAYALSFKHLAYRKLYMTLLIISMYFSAGIIPNYILLKSLNLFDSFWVYIVPIALSAFFVIVGISFFQEIPADLFDSAKVDGANDFTIFYKIVLPVSKAFLATIALFVGVNHWNSWFDSAFFVQNPSLKTLSNLMMELINKNQAGYLTAASAAAKANSTVTSFSVQTAAMVISVAPIICVYPFLQKYFVKGIMIGSVKG